MILFKCPSCGKEYEVKDDFAGRAAKCACGSSSVLPSPATSRAPAVHEEQAPPSQQSDTRASHFRGVAWGSSAARVKATETAPLMFEDQGTLGFQTELAAMPCGVYYIFAAGQFVRGQYSFTVEHSNPTAFIHDYGNLKDLLQRKYGPASEDREVWCNDLYKDHRDDWGIAISIGHLAYYAIWQSGEVTVCLFLNGDNDQIGLGIYYEHATYSKLEQAAKTQQDLDNL